MPSIERNKTRWSTFEWDEGGDEWSEGWGNSDRLWHGVGGSLLGGFLGAVLFGFDSEDGALQAGGVVGSIVGAVLLVIAVRLFRSRQSSN